MVLYYTLYTVSLHAELDWIVHYFHPIALHHSATFIRIRSISPLFNHRSFDLPFFLLPPVWLVVSFFAIYSSGILATCPSHAFILCTMSGFLCRSWSSTFVLLLPIPLTCLPRKTCFNIHHSHMLSSQCPHFTCKPHDLAHCRFV